MLWLSFCFCYAILIGEYYMVDFGYPCTMGFLPLYRFERYHLQDYRGRSHQTRTYKELFNYRHSSLRNIIEHCFSVLKNVECLC